MALSSKATSQVIKFNLIANISRPNKIRSWGQVSQIVTSIRSNRQTNI